MKKLFFTLVATCLLAGSYATVSTLTPPPKASEIMIPLGQSGRFISVLDLSTISVKDFQALSDRKLSLVDKLGFKLAQKKLRNSINADGSFNSRKVERLAREIDGETGFHLGGFALGFLLGLIGILIAYLIKDDKKKNRVKWAWIGLAAWIVLWLVFIL